MSRLFSILLVGALSATSPLLPSEARADSSVRSVAVVKLGADTQATAGILAAIEWSIRRYHKNYKVKNLHDILNTSESESFSQNRLVEAKSFMKTGLQALRSGKVDLALKQLTTAVVNMEASFAYLASPLIYRKLLLDLGSALFAAGDLAKAKTVFEKAALMRARPSYTKLTAPALTAFNAARTRVQNRERGGLQVISSPEAAEVYVNGVFRGVTPLQMDPDVGLLAGTHIISLKKLGYVRYAERVTIQPGKKATVEVDLEFASSYILMAQLLKAKSLPAAFKNASKAKPNGGSPIRRVAQILDSEVALLVKMSGPAKTTRVEGKIFDTASGRLLNTTTAIINFSFVNRNPVKAFVSKLLTFDYATALGAIKRTGPIKPIKKTSLTDRWWFWTLIGAAVIGATAGTIYAVVSQPDDPPFAKDGSGAIVLKF